MKTLVDRVFPGTLASLVQGCTHSAIEAWTFDDESSRRDAERLLARKGCSARIRSAYKPLVHFFLEEVDTRGLVGVKIVYPVHPDCVPERFLLEAYPLPALLPGVEVVFFPAESASGTSGTSIDSAGSVFYEVQLEYADAPSQMHHVFAPNISRDDHTGTRIFSACGWLIEHTADGSERGGPLLTDYEAVFFAALDTLTQHEWASPEPFFDRLAIQVTLPCDDRPLAVGDEVVSLREALHEELYFSVLELFQKLTGKPAGDRTIKPGQVVPNVVSGTLPSLKIELESLDATDCHAPTDEDCPALELLAHAPSPGRIFAELTSIEGTLFEARSYSGRKIPALHHHGTDKPVMISGGQHANETTGIVGALRAAKALAAMPGAHFTVAPLENPDGFALHRQLCTHNPAHMHHAARYTALGNDLEYQDEGCRYEKNIRIQAESLTQAALHINLHGYPAHEWTRPLTGYIPKGFPAWTLPHGFFLVLRHHAAWKSKAEYLVDRLTRALAGIPDLLRFTAMQLELYSRFVSAPPFVIVNGFPCDLQAREDSQVPLRLITEYPDETIHGPAYVAGHEAQKATVLAAYRIFQDM